MHVSRIEETQRARGGRHVSFLLPLDQCTLVAVADRVTEVECILTPLDIVHDRSAAFNRRHVQVEDRLTGDLVNDPVLG